MGKNSFGTAAKTAVDTAAFEGLKEQSLTPDEFCTKLAKALRVRPTEVALLRLDKGLLRFLFPDALKTAGAIPVSSSSSVAAHTAIAKKVELYNGFTKVKHASIFEAVRLDKPEDKETITAPEHSPIQKLMSAPVLNEQGKVLGVIQISRKGSDLRSAGPDFTLDDLQQLEKVAQIVANSPFMQPS